MADLLRAGSVPINDLDAGGDAAAAVGRGVALCLSGGGYRAMLFHLGGLIRLNELGRLPSLTRVSSVSGGSITAAVLGLRWRSLRFDAGGTASNLHDEVVEPILRFARRSIDARAIVKGIVTPGRSIGNYVASAYDRHLLDGATLQDLPGDGEGPRFVFNATNVQTGKLFRFSRPYMGDYTVGLWRSPTTTLADAVAASSAFPPFLSPHVLSPNGTFDPETAGSNAADGFRKRVVLSDGGVYDNLGLETSWKRAHTLYVSDGGGRLGAEPGQRRDWVRHSIRVASVVDAQVRTLRKRQLIDGYTTATRDGCYWGIRSDVEDYGLADPLDFTAEGDQHPANVSTRLRSLDRDTGTDLVNWGYVIADTAVRRWVHRGAHRPDRLPLP